MKKEVRLDCSGEKCHNKRYEGNWTGGGSALYTLTGTVIHGKGNGRKVGMPTANLYYAEGAKLPERGVYGVRARIDGKWYPGVTNVGTRPSVDDDPRMTVETFLPGEDMDLYGREMTIEFHIFLRGIRKFPSLEAVKEQVDQGIRRTLAYFEEKVPGGYDNEEKNKKTAVQEKCRKN